MWTASYETISFLLDCIFNGSTLLRDIFCDFCDSHELVLLIFLPRNFEIIVSF